MSQVNGKQVLPQFVQDIYGPALYAETKHFLIDHPDNPETMHLVHGCLEGPEHGVYARGIGRGPEVLFPTYWDNLVDFRTITVHITPMTALTAQAMPYIFRTTSKGFTLGAFHSDHVELLRYSWYAVATRKDVGPLVVERPKTEEPKRSRLGSILDTAKYWLYVLTT